MSSVDLSVEDIQSDLREIISRVFGVAPSTLSADTKLFNGGISLNSTQMIELTLAFETHYQIELEPELLAPEHFTNLETLAAMLHNRFFSVHG